MSSPCNENSNKPPAAAITTHAAAGRNDFVHNKRPADDDDDDDETKVPKIIDAFRRRRRKNDTCPPDNPSNYSDTDGIAALAASTAVGDADAFNNIRSVQAPPGRLGLAVHFFDEDTLEEEGAVVTAVHANCAFKNNVKPGDRVVMIDGIRVSKLEDLRIGVDKTRAVGIIATKEKTPIAVNDGLDATTTASKKRRRTASAVFNALNGWSSASDPFNSSRLGGNKGVMTKKKKKEEMQQQKRPIPAREEIQTQKGSAELPLGARMELARAAAGYVENCAKCEERSKQYKNAGPKAIADALQLLKSHVEQNGEKSDKRIIRFAKQVIGTCTQKDPQKDIQKDTQKATQKELTKIEKSNKRRLEAIKILAPRLSLGTNTIEDADWETTKKTISQSTKSEDAQDLHLMLMAISKANAHRAANAIVGFLNKKSSPLIKDKVLEAIGPKNARSVIENELIIGGIKDCIAHHSTVGTRTIDAETLVKNVILACVFKVVRDKKSCISDYAFKRIIGASGHQVRIACSRAQDLLDNNTTITAVKRKTRKDFIRDKLDPYVFDFLQDDNYTRVDTTRKPSDRLVEVVNPATGEKATVHRRTWIIVNKKQQHLQFTSSDYFIKFQNDNNGATVGYEIWSKCLTKIGSFVRTPLPES